MKVVDKIGRAALLLGAGLIVASVCCCGGSGARRRPLHVFAAASLSSALAEFEKSFEAKNPQVDVRLEVSGSLIAARKVSEYKRAGDIVISADRRVIESLLIPEFADWQVVFTSNEIVLAYSENSRHAAEVNSEKWPETLLDPEVRVGRVDADLAPLGYQTLLVWKLADIHYEKELRGRSVFETLLRRGARKLVRPDATELLPLLGTEADYIFVYRSLARDQNIKHVVLPAEVNLSSFAHKEFYSRASVTISGGSGRELTFRGEPILFSLTVVRDAPHRDNALSFVKMLLGREGNAVLNRHGFTPLTPPRYDGRPDSFPDELRGLLPEPSGEREAAR